MQEQEIIALLTQVGTDLQEMGLEEPIRLLLIGRRVHDYTGA